jgi:hypothetical protein
VYMYDHLTLLLNSYALYKLKDTYISGLPQLKEKKKMTGTRLPLAPVYIDAPNLSLLATQGR